MVRTIATLMILPAILAAPVHGATYYVAPDGSDEAPGTSAEAPLRTLSAAAAAVAAGDTVVIAPGRYAETVRLTTSGRADAPITLKKGPAGGEVVLTAPDPAPTVWAERYAVQLMGAEHVVLEGLTFRDCAAWVLMEGGGHNTIRGCTFDGADTYNCLRVNSSSFNRILDSTFRRARTRTGFREEAPWIPTPGADYIEIFRDSHNNLVQGCRFGRINHVAVSISAVDAKAYAPSRNIVRQCTMSHPYWKCGWIHGGPHNLFEDNTCSGLAANFVQLEAPRSIIRRNRFLRYRDSTDGQPDPTLRGAIRMQKDGTRSNRIYHNLFFANARTLSNNSRRPTVTDNVFKNNIFYRNAQTIFLNFPDYRTANRNPFVHNLILGTRADEKLIRLHNDTFTLDAAQTSLGDLFRGNLAADPRFVDPDKGEFRLKGDSPCIDAGAPLTTTTADGEGTRVPVADPLYFCDGFGMIAGDEIIVGANETARLVAVDYEKKILTLDRSVRFSAGDGVSLAFTGKAPDLGPYEHRDKVGGE
ncbi:MAG: right-handed parallel beta-helix repeat-containing protein [Planctomycetota bacterium]